MAIAIIGGTGVDEMACFSGGKASTVTTRFGSADIISGKLDQIELVFVPRHGLGHAVPPSRINYRAQIAALKSLQVDCAIGVCAVGSLKAELGCGSFAVLSDFIDLTKHRQDTFFDGEDGVVVHTDFTNPYCQAVSDALRRACSEIGVVYESQGIYVGVEGPRYESPAEIKLYASWGAHVIGMTNLPEVVLAREAGLCYGALAIVTNPACGISPTPLAHEEVREAMAAAGQSLQSVLLNAITRISGEHSCICRENKGLIL